MTEWLALVVLVPAVLVPFVLLFGFSGCHLVFQLERPPFEEAFKVDLTRDAGRANRTLVVRVEPVRLFRSGSQVRITLQSPTTGDLLINAIFISQAAEAGEPYDAAEDLTPVISAPLGIMADPANPPVELGPIAYELDHTKPLLIAFDISSAGGTRASENVPATDARTFEGPRLDPVLHEAGVADRQPGYTSEPRIYIVQKIEVA